MTVVKSTPVASFVVLALVWIARDWLPVFISLLMVLPVVWSNVCTGIRSTDPALLELAQVYGWPRGRILRRICLPGVRPHFLAALRSGIGFGWKSAIAAEVRGFNLRTRTSGYKDYPLHAEDFVALAVCVAVLAAAIVLAVVG